MGDLAHQFLVHEEADQFRRPLRRVVVELARIELQGDALEVVSDRWVAERVHAHADERSLGSDVAAEDLEDTDLGRTLRSVLIADHPQGDHIRRVRHRSGATLDQAVLWRLERHRFLLLADEDIRREPVLTEWAAQRPGEDAGLQR